MKSDWKLYKAGKWKTWDDHDIPVVYFWAETGYSNPFLNANNVLCPTNIDNNHWVLVRLDLVSQRVHVYSSTKPIGYEKKFQYMAEMIPKLFTKCGYGDLKPGFIVKDKWELKIEDAPQQTG